jgi:hypothetical protein
MKVLDPAMLGVSRQRVDQAVRMKGFQGQQPSWPSVGPGIGPTSRYEREAGGGLMGRKLMVR